MTRTASVEVRPAIDADLPAVAAIYAENVLEGTGTFETTPPTVEAMARRRQAVLAPGLPWLVAVRDEAVVGYAYASPFRTRAAYRYTAEVSVYVGAEAQGAGVGRALLDALVQACEALGLRQLLAVIGDSENAASIALHRACGFGPAGAITGVGWKFDRWLDVVFMQRALGEGADAAPGGPGLPLD